LLSFKKGKKKSFQGGDEEVYIYSIAHLQVAETIGDNSGRELLRLLPFLLLSPSEQTTGYLFWVAFSVIYIC
jgi:hypothetical protein